MRIIGAEFLRSVVDIKGAGNEEEAEVCFLGRSNVGKSSMINGLAGRKIARTSSTPGATRLINLFRATFDDNGKRGRFIISDFPGYGFSKAPKAVSQGWQKMIEDYILNNGRIKLVLWLFDIRRDMDGLDEMLMDWLLENGKNFCLVLTKSDKESQGNIARKKRVFKSSMPETPVFLFSSKTGAGKEKLLEYIAEHIIV